MLITIHMQIPKYFEVSVAKEYPALSLDSMLGAAIGHCRVSDAVFSVPCTEVSVWVTRTLTEEMWEKLYTISLEQ